MRLLAQAADGSMRDGLSLLDQVIAFGGGSVAEAQVRDMLGTVARDHVVKLAQLMIEAEPPQRDRLGAGTGAVGAGSRPAAG